MKNIDLDGLTCFKVKLKINRPLWSENMKYLVLESDPNPDYYAWHNFPPNMEYDDLKHLYLLVKNKINCFQDVILRFTVKLRKQFGTTMHIYPGSMIFHNENYQCVRIDTTNAGQLPLLIEELHKLGIHFVKNQKVHDYDSLVHYKKHIEYTKIEEGVYQDNNDPNRFFFQVKKHLEFDEFLKGIEQIKNTCEFHLFDAFLTDMLNRNEVNDFIGIYSKHCDKNRFGELK